MSGLLTDAQTVYEHLRYEVNLLELREERPVDPDRFVALAKALYYKHRFAPFYSCPVIAGLSPVDNTPLVREADHAGAFSQEKDFVVAGSASPQLYGICESVWREGLNPDELFQAISKCLIAAVERDDLSGWGGIVHVITPERIITREIKTRMD